MSKPSPILLHMPHHVKQKIVNSADTLIKLSLRQCSKEYKSLVDNAKICYEKLIFEPGKRLSRENDSVTVQFCITENDRFSLRFLKQDNGYLQYNYNTRTKKFVENDNYLDTALAHFEKLLKKRNSHWKKLEFRFNSRLFYQSQQEYEEVYRLHVEKLHETMSSLNFKVRADSLWIWSCDFADVLRILLHLQPGTLKEICLFKNSDDLGIFFKELSETEQYKQAVSLHLSGYQFQQPYEKWSHFSEISFETQEFPLTLQQSFFHKFMSDSKFEHCNITCRSLEHRQTLEYFFQYNPEIFGRMKAITLHIEVPDRPELWFRMDIKRNLFCFSKVRKDKEEIIPDHVLDLLHMIGHTTEYVKLEAADVLANVSKYID